MSVDSLINQFSELTEEYLFYNGEVTLHYEPKRHQYLLSEDGDLTPVDGVTSTCHIIDKSFALVPWACRMMAAKLLSTVPTLKLWKGQLTESMNLQDFQKLVLDAKDAHREQLEAAGDTGHTAHAWIETYIKLLIAGRDTNPAKLAEFRNKVDNHLANLPDDERAANCCKAALEWMENHKVHWLSTERKIYHRTYRYAGTMDGLCYVSSCSNPHCCKDSFKDRLTIADWKTSNYLYIEYLLQTAAYQTAYNDEMHATWVADNNSPHGSPYPVEDRWIIRLGKDDGDFQAWHATYEDLAEDWQGFLTALNLKRLTESITRRIKDRENQTRAAVKAERKAQKEAEEKAERERKAAERLRLQQERLEALKHKCKGADKYKGVRPPKCNGGEPCFTCRFTYALRNGHHIILPFDYSGPCDGEHAEPVCGSLHCWRIGYETRPERLLPAPPVGQQALGLENNIASMGYWLT